jgi:hypothetical protein
MKTDIARFVLVPEAALQLHQSDMKLSTPARRHHQDRRP